MRSNIQNVLNSYVEIQYWWQNLIVKKNPIVTTNSVEVEDALSLSSNESMMAFTLGQSGIKLENYDRYIRWVVTVYHFAANENEALKLKIYPLHPCTDEELNKFELEENLEMSKELQASKNLFCLPPEVKEI